jgi:hypothetical protein
MCVCVRACVYVSVYFLLNFVFCLSVGCAAVPYVGLASVLLHSVAGEKASVAARRRERRKKLLVLTFTLSLSRSMAGVRFPETV